MDSLCFIGTLKTAGNCLLGKNKKKSPLKVWKSFVEIGFFLISRFLEVIYGLDRLQMIYYIFAV